MWPPVILLSAFVLGVDPVHTLMKPYYVQMNWLFYFALLLLRFWATLIVSTVGSRVLHIFFIVGISSLRSGLNVCETSVRACQRLAFLSQNQMHYLISTFEQEWILFARWSMITDLMLLITVGIALGAVAVLNFVTFKMYSLFPFAFYLIFPFGNCFIMGLIQMLVPNLMNLYENSRSLLEKMSYKGLIRPHMANRYNRRRLKALRPWRFYAGFRGYNLFYFTQSSRVTYYENIINYTINLMFAVPMEHFQ
jgi:hypothetical protein